MAYPTLPTLTVREDELYVVKVQTNDSGDSPTILGQLQNIDINEAYEDRQYGRVGTGAVRKPGNRKTDVTLDIYVDDDLTEVARALGVMKPTTGWTSETISLDPNEVLQITIDAYDGTGSGASVVHQWSIPNFSPRTLRTGIQEGNPHMIQVSGASDALVGDPNPSA